MNEYTIYCTKEQTKKALKLGAHINPCSFPGLHYAECSFFDTDGKLYQCPTTEQMIGWLEERGFEFFNYKPIDKWVVDVVNDEFFTTTIECDSRKEATLAAIDSALGYLIDNKK